MITLPISGLLLAVVVAGTLFAFKEGFCERGTADLNQSSPLHWITSSARMRSN